MDKFVYVLVGIIGFWVVMILSFAFQDIHIEWKNKKVVKSKEE